MTVMRVLVSFCAFSFGFRTIFRSMDSKIAVFASIFVQLCGFLATKSKIFVGFAVFIAVFFARKHFLAKKFKPEKLNIVQFLDEMIMSMRSGISFERSFRALTEKNTQWNFFAAENGTHVMTNGQRMASAELEPLLAFCRENSSQSFKVLSSYREIYRLRFKLQKRHRLGSLQALGQAWISGAIYILITLFEWFAVPDFQQFLSTTQGRFIALISIALVAAGIKIIRSMAHPKELEI